MKEELKIAVFGSDGDHCTSKVYNQAYEVGKEIGRKGVTLLTGGGSGVMEAASKGAYERGGKVIGVIPGNDKSKANKYCTEIISTGEDFFKRSVTLANMPDSVIMIGGGCGTDFESTVTYWNLIPTIALETSGGKAKELAGTYRDDRCLTKVIEVSNPTDAVEKATQLGRNRRHLEARSKSVGVDLEVFRSKPKKFIRINPREPIDILELRRRLNEDYGIQTEFYETGIQGVYESSNSDIGGLINGKRNTLFNRRYFIQDLASVICVNELYLKEGQSFLETCAARGFKSILAHDLMKGRIDITALDIDPEKYEIMLRFFRQFGINSETYLTDATQYKGKEFDRVLVDAPCSCEGMVVVYNAELQRDVSGFDTIVQYSKDDVKKLAKLQGKLLQNGFDHLKQSGTLIYATCTLNREENENVVRDFLRRNKEASITAPNMDKYSVECDVSRWGVRIFPGKTKGFYFSKIKKS